MDSIYVLKEEVASAGQRASCHNYRVGATRKTFAVSACNSTRNSLLYLVEEEEEEEEGRGGEEEEQEETIQQAGDIIVTVHSYQQTDNGAGTACNKATRRLAIPRGKIYP